MVMNCQQVQQYLDDLLVARPDKAMHSGLIEHLKSCPRCAHEYEVARQTLASFQLSHKFQSSSNLKERIMSEIIEVNATKSKPILTKYSGINLWRPALAAGVAALLLVMASLFHWFGRERGAPVAMPAFSLLSQAWAAEEELFAGDGVVHIVNEIIVKPVSNPVLARLRWFPIMSLEATGKPRFHQLSLPTKPGEGYTVDDQAWYDTTTGRFVRFLAVNGKPIFANSYDGGAVYSLETGSDGALRVVESLITQDFQSPESPEEFLGITAGLPSRLNEERESLVSDAGEVTLSDGLEGRIVKVIFPQDGPEGLSNNYLLFTIRKDDNTIAEIEWLAKGESLLVVRRLRTETVEGPALPWNLAGAESLADDSREGPEVGIRPDMVVPNVSLQRMIEKADFETYIFAFNPPWTRQCQITDILDVASPPHRMFAVTYRADDGRHVVLVQSHTYNTILGPKAKTGQLLYESPKGFKVWSGPHGKWLAGILLKSARAAIKDPPSKDCTGYLLETPAGTFPALAINGQLTDDELHALIDSLVPAREYPDK